MQTLNVYLDESGQFRFGDQNDFLGGFICKSTDTQAIIKKSESLRHELAKLGKGKVHMREIPNVEGSQGHSLYIDLFRAIQPLVFRVVKVKANPSQYLGPTEMWHKAIIQAIVEIITRFPEPDFICHFHVSTRMKPVHAWLFQRQNESKIPELSELTSEERSRRDRYLINAKQSLLADASQILGRNLKDDQLLFLNPFQQSHGILDEIADAFCTAQSENRYFKKLNWQSNIFLDIKSSRLVPKERAIFQGYLESDQDPSQILWNLIVDGETSGTMYDRALILMNKTENRWSVFCDLVEKKLVHALSYGSDRYSAVNDYRQIAMRLPVKASSAPAQLTWYQQRSLQKCDAHQGVFSATWRDKLLEILEQQGIQLFPNVMARLQASIDVIIDDAQSRIVNPLRVDLVDNGISNALSRYLVQFPDAEWDMNIARLAGTQGQIHALQAPFSSYNRAEMLAKAWDLFELDLKHCWSTKDRAFALGYRTLTAFDQNDCDKAKKALEQECDCVLQNHPEIQAERNKSTANWMSRCFDLNDTSFFLLHHLQVMSLTELGASPAIKRLATTILATNSQTDIAYPRTLIAKWTALYLWAGNEVNTAVQILTHVLNNWDPKVDCTNALDHTSASIYALKLEMELGKGGGWWQEWAEQKLLPSHEHMVVFYQERVASLPTAPRERMIALATLLPFFYH